MKLNETFNRKLITDILAILLGCFIVAVGFAYFITPYKLVPGGVFGTSVVLHNFLPGVQVGTLALCIQVPLLILSIVFLGGNLGIRTLIATFAAPIMTNFLCDIAFTTPEALSSYDPALMFGGAVDLRNDMILACLIGGSLVGLGETFIIRYGASSGGTDIIAMLAHKFLKAKFSIDLILTDGAILLAGLVVIGLGIGLDDGSSANWTLSFYALITMIVMNRSLAWGLSGNRDSKLIHIVCEKDKESALRDWILHTLDRTATTMSAKGLYSEDDKLLFLMAVRDKEVTVITDQIRKIAPGSFVIVTDSYDVYGFRWSELPQNNGMDFK